MLRGATLLDAMLLDAMLLGATVQSGHVWSLVQGGSFTVRRPALQTEPYYAGMSGTHAGHATGVLPQTRGLRSALRLSDTTLLVPSHDWQHLASARNTQSVPVWHSVKVVCRISTTVHCPLPKVGTKYWRVRKTPDGRGGHAPHATLHFEAIALASLLLPATNARSSTGSHAAQHPGETSMQFVGWSHA
ncbi:MAG TPA: hypothetical protein VGL13_04340, partial [Polyangiaceae bacterium]